jgi:hypothetical protein
MKMQMFMTLGKVKPDRIYKRLQLGGSQTYEYDHSND